MSAARQTTWEDVLASPPTIDQAVLEGIAQHAFDARDGNEDDPDPAQRFARDSARGIAKGQGFEVAIDGGLPDGFDGIALLKYLLVIVRPSRDGYTLTLRILHELAHLILERLGWRHTHGDVWYLALAMAAPGSMLRELPAGVDPLDLAALAGVPAWAASMRLVMLGRVAA